PGHCQAKRNQPAYAERNRKCPSPASPTRENAWPAVQYPPVAPATEGLANESAKAGDTSLRETSLLPQPPSGLDWWPLPPAHPLRPSSLPLRGSKARRRAPAIASLAAADPGRRFHPAAACPCPPPRTIQAWTSRHH